MKAWLVTWDWAGEHARVEEPIAAIINPRTSAERAREMVEWIYVNSEYSLSERMQYANNRKFNPYPARLGSLEGVTWDGYIECGANPWLYARKVSDLQVTDDGNGNQKLTWVERSTEEIEELARKIRVARGIGSA